MSLRYQEIFNFINEKISQSGFEEKIPAGLVLTGGSSKAEGIVELAEEVFHKQVRVGIPQSLHGGSEDVVKNPEYAASVGLLLYAQKQNNHLLEAVNEDFMNIAKKLFQRLFYN
jgi:cell division protein FtsA